VILAAWDNVGRKGTRLSKPKEGIVADKSNQLVLTALSRAAAAADAVPLHGSKTQPGLFPANAAGKQAAERCQEDGYLRLITAAEEPSMNGDSGGAITVVKKKTASAQLCTITEKGLAYLLSQVSPRQVLEDFVRALEGRRTQADEMLHFAKRMQHGIEAMKTTVEKVLQQICKLEGSAGTSSPSNLKALFAGFLNDGDARSGGKGVSPVPSPGGDTALHDALLAELTRWQHSSATEDCPLPHLYRQASARSIGQFHDALRQLHDLRKIYLHPWTGPLYDIPEPPYALLIGHEIAYYASIRK
jgi:hypothetical protein